MLKFLREQLQKLLEQRKTLAAERDAVMADIEKRGTALTADDKTKLDEKLSAVEKVDLEVADLRARITSAEEAEKREQSAADAYKEVGQTGERREGGARIVSEPTAYGKGSRQSYFLDLARDQLGRGDGGGGVQAARQRLNRHAQELDVELPRREARRAAAADRALDSIEGLRPEQRASVFERGGMEQRVNPNRVDGQGGFCEMAAAAA